MWARLKRICDAITLSLFALALCSCAPSTSYAEETTGYITMTSQEWNDFKKDWNEQMMECQTLKANLAMLKASSTEQERLLLTLQTDCQTLEANLNETKLSLTKAQSSLKQAKQEIETCRKDLEALKKEIEAYKHEVRVAKRQRDGGIAIAAIAVLLAAC